MIKLVHFFINKNKCAHVNISAFESGKYCPDCGRQIVIKWYLLRCKCCNSKRAAFLHNRKIISTEKHCVNCGEHSYYLEEILKPNYFDVNYAVAMKEIADSRNKSLINTQVWIDGEEDCLPRRMIPQLNR